MSIITLELPEEIESKLRARANGKDVARVALELLMKGLEGPPAERGPQDLSYEEWNQRFEAWLKGHRRVDVVVDDSRETIYEGR